MTRGLRRLWPQRMRTRLAILYAAIFLLAGSALLALTYGLLASRLPAASKLDKQEALHRAQFARLCKQPGGPATPQILAKCQAAYAVGARAGSQDQRDRTLNTMLEVALIGLGVATLASAGAGWLISGRMLARLDATLEAERRFMANAAHELRTPLTAMRTAIDVTLSKPERTAAQLEAMAERVRGSVQRAEATIEALLMLAASEQRPPVTEPVDLALATEDALDLAAGAIAARRLTVDAALQPATIDGDRVLVERLVANLVDNAARYNVDGGWIAVRTLERDGSAVFEVENTGPVVPDELVPTLTEPFARAEQRLRPLEGVGLGLSIAKAIAVVHGGSLTVRSRADGGLAVSVLSPSR